MLGDEVLPSNYYQPFSLLTLYLLLFGASINYLIRTRRPYFHAWLVTISPVMGC
jgi:hypothetical protein